MTETKRRPGRPSKFTFNDRARAPLSVRLRTPMRASIEVSAKANGRSLSEEIEFRLEEHARGQDLATVIRETVEKSLEESVRRNIQRFPKTMARLAE